MLLEVNLHFAKNEVFHFARFLWFTDIHAINPEVVILRFARVAFGLTSSPFLLSATIKHHLEKYLHLAEFTKIIQKLILNLYVDDSTNTFNRVEDAIQFYKNRKLLSLMQVSILENEQRIVKRFKILLIINLRRRKL